MGLNGHLLFTDKTVSLVLQKKKKKVHTKWRVLKQSKSVCQQSHNGQDNAKNIFSRRDELTVDCGPASGQWFPHAQQRWGQKDKDSVDGKSRKLSKPAQMRLSSFT